MNPYDMKISAYLNRMDQLFFLRVTVSAACCECKICTVCFCSMNWLSVLAFGVNGLCGTDHDKAVIPSKFSLFSLVSSLFSAVLIMFPIFLRFAAALKDLQIWVMNVVPIDSTNTLPLIYERGLFGVYHDWCESFNTYPRTYDLLHADHLFSDIRQRCVCCYWIQPNLQH